ncbi:MAG: nucleotidyltransferase family protein [Methylovulum sp.]|nr:nucleotidyltransferase family protein [Methylovulum sp.]
MKEAIILAGGLGTRLYPLTLTVPKPMVPVAGQPFLEYLLRRLQGHGFNRVVLSVGYLGEQIEAYFGRQWRGLELLYTYEKSPLGTGGAIALAMSGIQSEHVLVLNGDTFCAVDWKLMFDFHTAKHADLSIALKPMQSFERYGNVKVLNDRVVSFEEKRCVISGQINTGVYILKKSLFNPFLMPEVFSFETDFLQCKLNEVLVCAFITEAYFIDIGVPEDYQRAQIELSEKV